MKRKVIVLLFFFILPVALVAKVSTYPIKVNALNQQTFPKSVPAGNYSGIVHISDNLYGIVNDKSPVDGYYVFKIDIDSVQGKINNVEFVRFVVSGMSNRDEEGIAFRTSDSTIYISGESDNVILQYALDGRPTGRSLAIPQIYKTIAPNSGFESLTYNDSTRTFWIANECPLSIDGQPASPTNKVQNLIRIQSFNDSLQPGQHIIYRMDVPEAKSSAANYAMGVSEMLALDDGSLLVLEREFYVPSSKLGSFVNCKLYQIKPETEGKNLVCQFKTSLSLFNYKIANYEGMCLGPKLKNGKRTIIMVSDSQNQYAGVLHDWFKVLTF